jgi:hypothetical protein
MRPIAMLAVLAWITACESEDTCELYCNERDACGDTEDVGACIDTCNRVVEGGGKDGQTDCGAIFQAAGECIEESSCEEFRSTCDAEMARTDECE